MAVLVGEEGTPLRRFPGEILRGFEKSGAFPLVLWLRVVVGPRESCEFSRAVGVLSISLGRNGVGIGCERLILARGKTRGEAGRE